MPKKPRPDAGGPASPIDVIGPIGDIRAHPDGAVVQTVARPITRLTIS
jgi:hypothetical protein